MNEELTTLIKYGRRKRDNSAWERLKRLKQLKKTPYDMLLEALDKSELDKFLIGHGEYRTVEPLVEYPANIATMFINALNIYCRDHSPASLNAAIEEALNELLKTPVGSWWCTVLVSSYLTSFIPGALLFTIDVDVFLPKMRAALDVHRQALLGSKESVGWRYEDGLWGDVQKKLQKIDKGRNDQNG